MTAYNFQNRFVELIERGDKPHTIRKRRKHPTLAGQMLQLYTGMRTLNCRKIIGEDVLCTAVVPIQIYPDLWKIVLDGEVMFPEDMVRFSKRDGFDTLNEFFSFFERYSPHVLEHELEVIYWRQNETY